MTSVTIEEVAVPATLDSPGAEDFIATVDVRNAVETDGFGTAEFEYGAAELLPSWLNSHEPKKLYAARVDGRIVARAIIEWEPEGSTVWLGVQVLPEFRNRGIGASLLDGILLGAANRGYDRVRTVCLPTNVAMRQLARKAGAKLELAVDELKGEITPPRPTFITWLREVVGDIFDTPSYLCHAYSRR